MSNNITIDASSLNRIVINLRGFDKEMAGATVSAINRTLQFVENKVGKIVTQEYSIKSKDVKDTLKRRKASYNNLDAQIISRGKLLSIAHFPHNPKSPGGRKKVIKVKVKKSEGYKSLSMNPKPFVMSTGAISDDRVQANIFQRVGRARFPVRVIRTLSVPQMIENSIVENKILDIAQQKLDERIQHEIEYRLNKLSSR